VDGRSNGLLRKATEESILNTAVPVCDLDLHSERTNKGNEANRRHAEVEIEISIFVEMV
jgi:hypothetical protein